MGGREEFHPAELVQGNGDPVGEPGLDHKLVLLQTLEVTTKFVAVAEVDLELVAGTLGLIGRGSVEDEGLDGPELEADGVRGGLVPPKEVSLVVEADHGTPQVGTVEEANPFQSDYKVPEGFLGLFLDFCIGASDEDLRGGCGQGLSRGWECEKEEGEGWKNLHRS